MFHRNPASFRDPDGFVFGLDGEIYRSLTIGAYAKISQHERFYRVAVEKGLLLPFDSDVGVPAGADGIAAVIKPEMVSLITYPHEWSFEQLKDAALNTLDVNILALEFGLTLKDASAFNNQVHEGRTVFIDHTSFEETEGKLPWRPYSQFCRHFLNPLVVASYRDFHTGAFFRLDLDGLSQQTANDLLPWRACLTPSILMHVILHNRYVQKSSSFEGKVDANAATTHGKQSDLLKQLRAFIAALKPARATSTWSNYYEETNYGEKTFARKKELVAGYFTGRRVGTIWDVGANDGMFSRLVAGAADQVLALDLDHNAVNVDYTHNRQNGHFNIYSLVYNVGNPTPALGFENRERTTLEERSKADAVVALAVIHHLSLTNNIPLEQSASYFAQRGAELVIEFVGREDSQVKRLLAQKNVPYDWYNEDNFRTAFGAHFDIRSRHEIEGTERMFYHLVRR